MIGRPEWCERQVEHLVIGAMGSAAALSHFRRRANKVVITGGDRADLQLAALETSTSALVLTGSIRPPATVLDKAEEQQVPVIIVSDDTLTTVERSERVFGHIRFKQASKMPASPRCSMNRSISTACTMNWDWCRDKGGRYER